MHIIEANNETLHSYFSTSRQPVLTIKSGETVRYKNLLDARWYAYDADQDGLVQDPMYKSLELRGHAIVGPIAIEGAKKGMVVEVQIGDIHVGKMGWNEGGGSSEKVLWERLGVLSEEPHMVYWRTDDERKTATSDYGAQVKLAPFLGVIGMPINNEEQQRTAPPRFTGGNIDCKHLTSGTTLYLPIDVDGALLSVGDGHGVQGDGESSGTALEIEIEQVDLTFILHENMRLSTPKARIHNGWMTLGFHEDLDEAAMIALNAMLDLMEADYGLTRQDALSLASVVVDLHITQIVNGVKGVQAILKDDAFTRN